MSARGIGDNMHEKRPPEDLIGSLLSNRDSPDEAFDDSGRNRKEKQYNDRVQERIWVPLRTRE